MKKHIVLVVLLFSHYCGFSQDTSNSIILTPYVSGELADIPDASQKNLHNKLSQIILAQGLSNGEYGRFILTASINKAGKEVTATAPPMQVYSLNITFYIGDGFDGLKYSAYSTTVKGVGETDVKAYSAAIKNIKVDNPAYHKFIEEGKAKIVDYYNTNVDLIIKESETLAALNKYEDALVRLGSIPRECTDAYSKAYPVIEKIYKEYIDYSSCQAVSNAKNYWLANQDHDAANQVAMALSQVDQNSICYKDAKSLAETVGKRVKELDQREWNFLLKMQENEANARKTTAQALGDFFLSYAKNHRSVTYRVSGW